MRIQKKEFLFTILAILALFSVIMIVLEIPQIERDLKNNVKKDMIRSIGSIIDNYDNKLQINASKNPNQTLVNILKNDPNLRNELESDLSMIISEDIKYSYVLYRDNNHKFRFMLDGAIQDKAAFGQKFDVENQAWERAYQTKKAQYFEQKDLYSLWLTYLNPIVIDDKVQGIVAIDFSLEGKQHITDIIQPLHKYVWIFLALLALGIIIAIFQYILYRLSQKRVYLDPLTGLYNRNFFNDFLSANNYQKYAIAMMDLDKFKVINDTYGHDVGDEVLKAVSNTLKSSIREHDTLVRYGGEEFLLYLSIRDIDHSEIKEIVNRIRQNVESIIIKTGLISIRPTISIGLNFYTSHFKDHHSAISMADKMLYQAKKMGRNIISVYTPDQSITEHSIDFLNVHHVKEAIEEKRVFCEYQPLVDLRINQIVGYEALARIRDRNGTIIYPGMFLPNIANSNIYKELTLTLLDLNFKKVHEEKCCISVNLNITDILDDDIYNAIITHLKNSHSDAKYLTFELLEEEQISNLDSLKDRVASLHAMGSKISIDDFGSGYSNFSHIFALDVDVIKIDGTLIKDIVTSEISQKIVEAIVGFALTSDKKVIAEYVHSFEVMEVVKKLGIVYGQGFYLGKPKETLATASAHL